MVPKVFIKRVEEYKEIFTIKEIKNWIKDMTLSEQRIIQICQETDYIYGYRTLVGMLRQEGINLNKNTVQRIMQKHGLQCRVKQKQTKVYAGRESYVAPNILNRKFHATRPLEKLVTDIT